MRELGVHHHDTGSRAYFTIKRRQPNYSELCIFATLGRKFLRIFKQFNPVDQTDLCQNF